MFQSLDCSQVLVALKDSTLLGATGSTTMLGEDDLFKIERMGVHKDFRKAGVATVLLDATYRSAVELGYKRVHLTAKPSAKSFYLQKQGFEVADSLVA